MQCFPVNSPPILPSFVACCAARLPAIDHRLYFAAGRRCAAEAIVQLDGHAAITDVPKGKSGAPVWPEGLVGSITHSGDFVAAAVARRSEAQSLGLDVEHLISADRAAAISRHVLLPRELDVGGDTLSPARRVILFFSIKETVFKCLFPLVLTRFYYDALAVTAVDFRAGTFHAELVTNLSDQFPLGRTLSGRFAVDDRRVYSAMWLLPDAE
jgi:enterobactin synthetase component D